MRDETLQRSGFWSGGLGSVGTETEGCLLEGTGLGLAQLFISGRPLAEFTARSSR